jgi:hypothetical protein
MISIASVSLGLAMASAAYAFTVTGTVKDESGKAVQNASVSLLGKALDTKTDATGAFTIHQDEAVTPGDSLGQGEPCVAGTPGCDGGSDALFQQRAAVGYLSVNGGVLSFSQGSGSPVHVQVFDMVGNRLLNETLYGSGTVNMKASVKAKGVYFARVRVGNAQQNFRFTADGSFNATFGTKTSAKALLKVGDSDDLRVVADGFATLNV